MKKPKKPPNLYRNLAQFVLFLSVLGCLLIESPNITWGGALVRLAIIVGAGFGIIKLEGGKAE